MTEFVFAFLAGILTLINPCVLPVLPIVVAGALGDNKFGPVALVAGLCFTFTSVGVVIAAFGPALGIDEVIVSRIAAIFMIFLGIVVLLPNAITPNVLSTKIADLANDQLAQMPTKGLGYQFLGGALLGAAWAPCIGPTLGGALALAYEQSSLPYATAIMLTFSLGVASVMLIIAYGTKGLVAKFNSGLRWMANYAKYIIGITFLVMGFVIYFDLHKAAEIYLLQVLPDWLVGFSTMF